MKILALDFGGSSVKYSLIDSEKNRMRPGKVSAPLDSHAQFADTLVDIWKQYPEAEGVAVSMPGFINSETGDIRTAGAYYHMYGTNLYELLGNRITVPVTVENDGKCAALAEAWIGSLQGVREGAVMIIGSGYAGGVIHDGRLLRGFTGTAGEFSFIGLPSSLDLTQSPLFRGCMSGLTLHAAQVLGVDIAKCEYRNMAPFYGIGNTRLTELNDDPRFARGIDGLLFFELLEEGNEKIATLYADFIATTVQVLLTIQSVTDPEYIVLGGPVTNQPCFFPDLEAELHRYDRFLGGNSLPIIRLRRCTAEGYPNEYGAVYSFMQRQGLL